MLISNIRYYVNGRTICSPEEFQVTIEPRSSIESNCPRISRNITCMHECSAGKYSQFLLPQLLNVAALIL